MNLEVSRIQPDKDWGEICPRGHSKEEIVSVKAWNHERV